MARKKNYSKSKVLSIRMSADELQEIQEMLAASRMKRVSDLMREAIHLFGRTLQADQNLAPAEASGVRH